MTSAPHIYLQRVAQQRRHVWREYDRFRASRGKDLPAWPDWCFCPISASYAIVSQGAPPHAMRQQDLAEVAALGALSAWRATQGVYRFDPDLLAELTQAEITGDIPAEILHRLPEWCVYIEYTGSDRPGLVGFFAHLEWDANTGREELRLVLDCDPHLIGVPIHLGGSVADGLRNADRAASAQMALLTGRQTSSETFGFRGLEATLAPLVNLVLYLCSAEPDLGDAPPRVPRVAQTPRGPRISPPSSPLVHDTGYRIGAALRRAARERTTPTGTGASTQPHVRRAHWHTYWVGPRGNQRRELRWISPTLVGFEPGAEVEPVVRPVR